MQGDLPCLKTKAKPGSTEMAYQLRGLAALPEDPNVVPSTHTVAQPSVSPVPGNPIPSSIWPPRAPGIHVMHRHTYKQNTHIPTKHTHKTSQNQWIIQWCQTLTTTSTKGETLYAKKRPWGCYNSWHILQKRMLLRWEEIKLFIS